MIDRVIPVLPRPHYDMYSRGCELRLQTVNLFKVTCDQSIDAHISDRERSWSSKYRRWLRDGKAPNDETIQHVSLKSGGKVDLQRWRDLALWDVLQHQPPTIPEQPPPEHACSQLSTDDAIVRSSAFSSTSFRVTATHWSCDFSTGGNLL